MKIYNTIFWSNQIKAFLFQFYVLAIGCMYVYASRSHIFRSGRKFFSSRTRQIKIQITSSSTHKGIVLTYYIHLNIMYWFWRALAANNLALSSSSVMVSPWNVETRPFLVPVIVWSILHITRFQTIVMLKVTVASPDYRLNRLDYRLQFMLFIAWCWG